MADLFDIVVARKLSGGGGGGGSSDFSTATVTVVNQSDEDRLVASDCPRILSEDFIETIFSVVIVPPSTTSVFIVPLYKGKCLWGGITPDATSGNISYDENLHYYVITGDCTITATGGGR